MGGIISVVWQEIRWNRSDVYARPIVRQNAAVLTVLLLGGGAPGEVPAPLGPAGPPLKLLPVGILWTGRIYPPGRLPGG